MRPTPKSLFPVLATGGVLAALGITALPMLPVWTAPAPTFAPVPSAAVAPLSSRLSVEGVATGELLVDLRDFSSDAQVAAFEREFGIDLRANSALSDDNDLYRVRVPAGTDAAALIARLKADGRVEAAEPELLLTIPGAGQAVVSEDALAYTVPVSGYSSSFAPAPVYGRYDRGAFTPDDPRYSEQWNFRMIGVEDAWKRTRGKGAVVAVIDTGVNVGPTKKGQPSEDFAQTAYTKGYDFVNDDADPYDDHGHGTHVAGTIAESTNNGLGVAGIAFDATIMPLKVLSAQGSGSSGDIADAIRFAADNGAKVINMSLGSSMPSDVIHKAVKYAHKKGVTIVCAAGNSFREGVGYPAAFPECVAVSSVGPTGQLAKYSSWGKQVALAAPGGDMIDSGDAADGILQNTTLEGKDGYYAFQGTSMASPHVAGVAALVVSQGVSDPARVRDILLRTATPNGEPKKYGAGILSASAATAKASQNSAVKLRHLLVVGLGCMLFTVGGGRRRSWGLRAAMGGALALGMFGPDYFTAWVGADSAWNLLGFSALAPMAAYAFLRRGPGVKMAGALALGTAINLYANLHNDSLPFTGVTFGDAALPWTYANLGASLALGAAAAWRASRATAGQRPAA